MRTAYHNDCEKEVRGRKPRHWRLGIALAVLFLGLSIGSGWYIGGGDFLRQHWQPLTLAALLASTLIYLASNTIFLAMRGTANAFNRPRALGESGAAAAEFAIICVPFLTALFALMQLALASLARVLVSYAAFAAARAAIVILPLGPGDPHPMANSIGNEGPGKIGYAGNLRLDYVVSRKAALMRNAASYVLIPASPAIDVVVEDTMNNWSTYWENRKNAGLSPLDMAVQIGGDILQLPSDQQQNFDDQVRDIFKDGLDTPAEKAAAKARVDALVADLPEDKREAVRAELYNYIDNYSGGGVPGDGSDEWAIDNINDSMQGGLGQFRDALIGMYWAARGSSSGGGQGGDFTGYSVDRALDAGFGATNDGAGGAVLRALRKFIYARIGTVVTLHNSSGALRSRFSWGEPVTAKVTYLYYCQIPIANRIAGRPFYDLPIETQLDMTTGALKYGAAVGLPGYFMALTAQHTLVNQGRP